MALSYKTKMTKSASQSRVSGLVIGGRSDVTTLEPHLKSAIKPYSIRHVGLVWKGRVK